MSRGLSATAVQLAWYIERDGAVLEDFRSDGSYVVRSTTGVRWYVPASDRAELDAARDRVYPLVAAHRRRQLQGDPR